MKNENDSEQKIKQIDPILQDSVDPFWWNKNFNTPSESRHKIIWKVAAIIFILLFLSSTIMIVISAIINGF